MENTTKFLLIIFISTICANNVFAQKYIVENVALEMEKRGTTELPDLNQCVEWIEKAQNNTKTANYYEMWYYKGLTYLELYINGTDEQKSLYKDAIFTAYESFFKAIETDISKKKKIAEKSKVNLLNVALGLYNEGIIQYQNSNFKESISSMEKIVQIFPFEQEKELEMKSLTIQTVNQLIYSSYFSLGEYGKAKKYIKQLLESGFDEPKVHNDLVSIYLLEKDTTQALQVLSSAREYYPENTSLLNAELDIYIKQGRSEELVSKLSEAIETNPDNKLYYFARAVSHDNLGNYYEAQRDYKLAIEIDPAYYDAFYNLGVLYVNQSNPLTVKYEKANTMAEQDKIYEEILSWYKKALVEFEVALENPEMSNEDKYILAETMKKLYAKTQDMDKFGQMKNLMKSLQE